MSYAVKEMFLTLQGEGANAGRAAVFVRFAGCNLWSGRGRDRGKGSGGCSVWCDTDFVGTDGPGGGKFGSAREVAVAALNRWPGGGRPLAVLTGGEPLLQTDDDLVATLQRAGFEVAVETNGTRPLPAVRPDWVTVSPKAGTELLLGCGDELKLVFPQTGAGPERFADLDFRRFYLQPMDGPNSVANTRAAVEYCLGNPRWRLSVQTHKLVNIP